MSLSDIHRRSVVLGGAMLLTSAAAYAATPRRVERELAHTKLGSLIARKIGPWQVGAAGGIVLPNEESINTDGYDQLLTRVYQADGLPTMMLLIAYGSTQGGTLQLHRPETCYPGQGFRLDQFDDDALPFSPGRSIDVRRFTARRDDRVERLVYWTRIGHSFPRNTAEEYRAIISSVVAGVVPDGILARISTIDTDIAQADAAITRFAHALIATAQPGGRQILLGDSI